MGPRIWQAPGTRPANGERPGRERHKARAQKHKEVVDAKIAAAQADKGLLLC
jgi:hypothetical protein